MAKARRPADHGDDDGREWGAEFNYVLDGRIVTVRTWMGPAADWEARGEADRDRWSVVRTGGMVGACRIQSHGPCAGVAERRFEACIPSIN